MIIELKRSKKTYYCSDILKIVEVPLSILRNYTIPMAEDEMWDKRRAMILPNTILWAFFYLFGFF